MVTLQVFASQVVAKLYSEFRALRHTDVCGFSIALVEALGEVEKRLHAAADSDKLILLHKLELLIQWPKVCSVKPLPEVLPARFDGKRFAGLYLLVSDKPWGKNHIKAYARSRREVNSRSALLEFLATLKAPTPTLEEPKEPESASPITRLDTEDSSQEYIRILYKVLSKVWSCMGSKTDIPANLRLRSCGKDSSRHASFFRIFFLDHPHHELAKDIRSCHWQDTAISVFRKQAGFECDKAMEQDGTTEFLTAVQFCEIISENSRVRLNLELFHRGIVIRNKSQRQFPFQDHLWMSPSSISFPEILDSARELPQRTRLLFCYQLSKAFWRFYGTDWMAKPWTKEKVHFMVDSRSNEPNGILLHDPYLTTFDQTAPPSKSKAEPSKLPSIRSHLFPKVLALGIMLTEIELGLKIENHFHPDCYDKNGNLSINAMHTTGQFIYEQERELWAKKATLPQVEDVIATCLAINPRGDPFMKYTDDDKRDLSDLRDAIHQYIVNPLETLCRRTWWVYEPDPEKWDIPAFKISNNSNG
ncbi:MAG: hypothetical protein M1822_002365 [Bathelium mastoideum]|nr:MAG: hypothetical protein M1822_002365 [Bathelium mastoideum]